MKVFILLACLLVAVYARSAQQESQEWQLFKAHHAKNYANAKEEQHRMKIFLENKAFVENHNKRFANGEVSYTVELNKFADLTKEEFAAQYNTYKPHSKKTIGQKVVHTGAKIPKSVDWRKSGAVTPVKDQQQCGSCWAFSATGSIESQHQIATGKLVSLSEQQLVDCSTENLGCEGGNQDAAFEYIVLFGGLETEASYPYTAEDDKCKAKKSKIAVSIKEYQDITSGDEASLTTTIANVGPVSVSIDASHASFQMYSSGVYDEPDCSTSDLDHAVLAVGYGTLNGKDYYIVKNSWGADWGQSGYIFMARNAKNQCGIASGASYPMV